MRIKIIGAGSIGNHMAHAALTLGWSVTVCDISDIALQRMKEDIFPTRYGQWDQSIQLYNINSEPRGNFDLIHIGTPPPTHTSLALQALDENPNGVIVEKPVCTPSLENADTLYQMSKTKNVLCFAGYNHAVSKAVKHVEKLITESKIGKVLSLDLAFRENWAGIFAAHPWLSGPKDTYLGFWAQGGGASGEHSHAIHLWQHFANFIGAGRVAEVDAMLRYNKESDIDYDDQCFLHLKTENGLIGRVVQDVLSKPTQKKAYIQGTDGALEWVCNYNKEGDAVINHFPDGSKDLLIIPKTRPDDFIEELRHVQKFIQNPEASSPLDISRGLETMMVVSAAHLSEREGNHIKIDYEKGFNCQALSSN